MSQQKIDVRAAIPLKVVECGYVVFAKVGDDICYVGSAVDNNDLSTLTRNFTNDFGNVTLKAVPTGKWVNTGALHEHRGNGRGGNKGEDSPQAHSKSHGRSRENREDAKSDGQPHTKENSSDTRSSPAKQEDHSVLRSRPPVIQEVDDIERERRRRTEEAAKREKEMMSSMGLGGTTSGVSALSADQISKLASRKRDKSAPSHGENTQQKTEPKSEPNPLSSTSKKEAPARTKIDDAMEQERALAAKFTPAYDSESESGSDND